MRHDSVIPAPGEGRTRLVALLCLVLVCLCLTPGSLWAGELRVAVVLSGHSRAYTETAERLEARLSARGTATVNRTIGLAQTHRLDRPAIDVVVTLGVRAAEAVAAMDLGLPVIHTLIPSGAYASVAERHDGDDRFTAIYMDQPLERQLEMIRLALPERERVGVLIGDGTEKLLEPLREAARARGMELSVADVDGEAELFPALERVLKASDIVLSLPDPKVVNASTVRSILLTSYRFRVPVMGFSPAYVRAGAVMAVHSAPDDLARQVVDLVDGWEGTSARMPPPQYPDYFRVRINRRVARSLGLSLDSEADLARRLREQETGR